MFFHEPERFGVRPEVLRCHTEGRSPWEQIADGVPGLGEGSEGVDQGLGLRVSSQAHSGCFFASVPGVFASCSSPAFAPTDQSR